MSIDLPSGKLIVDPRKLSSHSSLGTMRFCDRAFVLDKYKRDPMVENYDLNFGKTVGAGVQALFIPQPSGNFDQSNINAAYITAFKEFKGDLDNEDTNLFYNQGRQTKTFWHAINAIDLFIPHRRSKYSDYDIAMFDGRPALELGFCIDLGNGHFHRGFVDVILKHKRYNNLLPLEIKTTKSWNPQEAAYKNSGQSLGYSLIADQVAKTIDADTSSGWRIDYPIFCTASNKTNWTFFEFTKSRTQRVVWLKNLILAHNHIQERIDDNGYFPMDGGGCYRFAKVCSHFDYCEFSDKVLFPSGIPEVVEDFGKYQFHFKLEDIVNSMLD